MMQVLCSLNTYSIGILHQKKKPKQYNTNITLDTKENTYNEETDENSFPGFGDLCF